MAGLSATAQNSLRGAGYGTNVNPNLSYVYGLGYASSGYDVKKLNEQIELAEKELDEQIRQWNTGTLLNLVGSGYGTKVQQEGLIRDLTGYDLSAPKTKQEQMEDVAKRLSMNTPARDVYSGYGSFRPESQKERETRLYGYMMGLTPMSGHNTLSFGAPAAQAPTTNPRNPTLKNPLLTQNQATPATTTGLVRRRKA